jgi:hypothetical protein
MNRLIGKVAIVTAHPKESERQCPKRSRKTVPPPAQRQLEQLAIERHRFVDAPNFQSYVVDPTSRALSFDSLTAAMSVTSRSGASEYARMHAKVTAYRFVLLLPSLRGEPSCWITNC